MALTLACARVGFVFQHMTARRRGGLSVKGDRSMIALASDFTVKKQPAVPAFVDLLPTIMRYLERAFRRFTAERKEDAIQETLTHCYVAYDRLLKKGRGAFVFPSALA